MPTAIDRVRIAHDLFDGPFDRALSAVED